MTRSSRPNEHLQYLFRGCSFCGKLALQRFLFISMHTSFCIVHPWENESLGGCVWFKGIKDELKVVQREPCKSKREPTRCLGGIFTFYLILISKHRDNHQIYLPENHITPSSSSQLALQKPKECSETANTTSLAIVNYTYIVDARALSTFVFGGSNGWFLQD
jgi:hypothetical protein